MTDLVIEGDQLHSRNPLVKLDFGAYGKGYGIAQAMQRLKQLGVHDAILNAGGDLSAMGRHLDRPWRVAIRHPRREGALASLELHGEESVFTSGDYERAFTYQGKHYHHIIDPRTGRPAQGTESVTVIDADPTRADAAATALFVAGPAEWYATARTMHLRYVLLVDARGTLHMNPAMAERIQLLETPAVPVELSPPL